MRTRNLFARRPSRPTSLLFAVLGLTGVAQAQEARPGATAETTPPAAPAAGTDATVEAESCGSAYERAQTERLAGHYVAASEAALSCSQLRCNAAIVKECVRFYESLEQDTPSLVLSARKSEGGELITVRVEMDGKLVATEITGRPLKVDPGQHTFVFTDRDRGRMQVTETARVGDRSRVIEVTFADPNAKKLPPLPPPDSGGTRSHGVPVMTYVLGGVGIVGLAGFVGFRLSASKDFDDYHSTCAPRCPPGDVDSVRRGYTFSYISLGIGAAGLVGAGLVYFLAPNRSSEVQASILPQRDGATAALRARF